MQKQHVRKVCIGLRASGRPDPQAMAAIDPGPAGALGAYLSMSVSSTLSFFLLAFQDVSKKREKANQHNDSEREKGQVKGLAIAKKSVEGKMT